MSEVLIGLIVVGALLWWTTRYYGQRPKTFAEISAELAVGLDETRRAIGLHLYPAVVAAAAAFAEFESTLQRINSVLDE